jgi:hypothetical protein
MAELVSCIDCAHLISPSARTCPKCLSEYPRGVHCTFCYGRFPRAIDGRFPSAAIPTIKHISISDALSYDYHGTTDYYHLECVKRLLTPPANSKCPDCNIPISQYWDWERIFKNTDWYNTACQNCGSRNILMRGAFPSFCDLCHLPLLHFHNEVSQTIPIKHFHDSCVPYQLKQAQEREHRQSPNEGSGCAVLTLTIFLLIFLVFMEEYMWT